MVIFLIYKIWLFTCIFNFVGTDAASLVKYSVSHNSKSLYIATLDITDTTLYGQWTVTVESVGAYRIQVLGNGELSFISKIITATSNGDDINDLKPLGGKTEFFKSNFLNKP